jgi:hypothetical protein
MSDVITESDIKRKKKFGMAGQSLGQQEAPKTTPNIISGSKQDPNDPDVIRQGPKPKQKGVIGRAYRMMRSHRGKGGEYYN